MTRTIWQIMCIFSFTRIWISQLTIIPICEAGFSFSRYQGIAHNPNDIEGRSGYSKHFVFGTNWSKAYLQVILSFLLSQEKKGEHGPQEAPSYLGYRKARNILYAK